MKNLKNIFLLSKASELLANLESNVYPVLIVVNAHEYVIHAANKKCEKRDLSTEQMTARKML